MCRATVERAHDGPDLLVIAPSLPTASLSLRAAPRCKSELQLVLHFRQLLAETQTTPSRRLVFALVIAAAYLSVTLYPYTWGQPLVANHAAWRSSNILAFDARGIARTEAPPTWLNDVRSTHQLKISLRVRPHGAFQSGPARIFTVSSDPISPQHHNWPRIAADLVLRLRTPEKRSQWDAGTPRAECAYPPTFGAT